VLCNNEADTIAPLAATTPPETDKALHLLVSHSGLSTIYRVSGKVLAIGLDIAFDGGQRRLQNGRRGIEDLGSLTYARSSRHVKGFL